VKLLISNKGGSGTSAEKISRKAVFWLTISLLVLVPLAFSTGLHRIYVIPKLALLLIGGSALIPLIAFGGLNARYHENRSAQIYKSRHIVITALFMVVALNFYGLEQ
jgi:uncharacterized membrane protein